MDLKILFKTFSVSPGKRRLLNERRYFVIQEFCYSRNLLRRLIRSGYAYVTSFNMGIRIILVVHGLVLFFLFFALSLNDLKSCLVFAMLLVIPMSIDFSLVRYLLYRNTHHSPKAL